MSVLFNRCHFNQQHDNELSSNNINLLDIPGVHVKAPGSNRYRYMHIYIYICKVYTSITCIDLRLSVNEECKEMSNIIPYYILKILINLNMFTLHIFYVKTIEMGGGDGDSFEGEGGTFLCAFIEEVCKMWTVLIDVIRK